MTYAATHLRKLNNLVVEKERFEQWQEEIRQVAYQGTKSEQWIPDYSQSGGTHCVTQQSYHYLQTRR